MADVTQDSFDEAQRMSQVVFQTGRDVWEFELNELQTIQRVSMYRALAALSFPNASSGTRYVASSGDGFRVDRINNSSVYVRAGVVVADGVPVRLDSDAVLALGANPSLSNTRIILVYMSVTEVELDDPKFNSKTGATTRRRRFAVQLLTAAGTPASIPTPPALPASSASETWNGGTRYYLLSTLKQPGSSSSDTLTCEDERKYTPDRILPEMVRRVPISNPTTDKFAEGAWTVTCGNGITNFGDFNGAGAVSEALEWIWGNLSTNSLERFTFKIHVKSGVYIIDDFRSTSGLNGGLGPISKHATLHISGEGSNSLNEGAGTVIQLSGSSATVVGAANSNLTDLKFEDICFRMLGTSGVLDLRGCKRLRLVGCMVDNVRLVVNTPTDSITFDDCQFYEHDTPPTATAWAGLLNFQLGVAAASGGSSNARKILINNCSFVHTSTDSSSPSIALYAAGTSTGLIRNFVVRDSVFQLMGATSGALSGKHSAQTGMIRIVTPTTTSNITIRNFSVSNCSVQATSSPSPSAYGSCLLDWHGSGGTPSLTGTPNPIHVRKFSVLDTYFEMNIGEGQKFPAIRIQGSSHFNGRGLENVTFRGCRLRITATSENAVYGIVNDAHPTVSTSTILGGLLCLSAGHITIDDFEVTGWAAQTNAPDISLCPDSGFTVNNLHVHSPTVAGGGAAPTNRIRIVAPASTGVEQLQLTMSNSTFEYSGLLASLLADGSSNAIMTWAGNSHPTGRTRGFTSLIENVVVSTSQMVSTLSPCLLISPRLQDDVVTVRGGLYSNEDEDSSIRVTYNAASADVVAGLMGTVSVDNVRTYGGPVRWEMSGNVYPRGMFINNCTLVSSVDNNNPCLVVVQSNPTARYNRSVGLTVTNNTFVLECQDTFTPVTRNAVTWSEATTSDQLTGVFMGNNAYFQSDNDVVPDALGLPRLSVHATNPVRIRGIEVVGAAALNNATITVAGTTAQQAFNNMEIIRE
jgi:hypothetical protein